MIPVRMHIVLPRLLGLRASTRALLETDKPHAVESVVVDCSHVEAGPVSSAQELVKVLVDECEIDELILVSPPHRWLNHVRTQLRLREQEDLLTVLDERSA